MTYDAFAKAALSYPGVTERVKRTEIDLVREGGHIARLRDKGTLLAIRLPWENIEEIKANHPQLLVDHPHYRGWPYACVLVESLDIELAEALIRQSYEAAPLSIPRRQL
jgi:hypothetical protein